MLPRKIITNIEEQYAIHMVEIKILGSGSNGSVYRIKGESGGYLCVKSIRVGNPSIETDFDIVWTMYDSDSFRVRRYKDDTFHFIIMPFFSGEDLSKIVCKPLEHDIRAKIFNELVNAVHRMHEKGILHRDLKAENIIVDVSVAVPVVSIVDFGRSAKLFDSNGKALSTPERLSLANTTNSWTSFFFYPAYQVARWWQSQTPPELTTLSSHFFGYIHEAQGVGLRTDYYAVAKLFKLLFPDHSQKADAVIRLDGPDRSSAYHELLEYFNKSILPLESTTPSVANAARL